MKKGGIYNIRNLINNKLYIGSSININRRWSEHKNKLKYNRHPGVYLQRSYDKYGKENFIYEVIEYIEDNSKLLEREQIWLDLLKPEYNTCKIAGNILGTKRSEEYKQKCRDYSKKIGRKPPQRKPVKVDQFTLEGKFIKTYDSITKAAQETNSRASNIVDTCKGKANKHNNYIWRYTNK